jgi:hypothetical protein
MNCEQFKNNQILEIDVPSQNLAVGAFVKFIFLRCIDNFKERIHAILISNL